MPEKIEREAVPVPWKRQLLLFLGLLLTSGAASGAEPPGSKAPELDRDGVLGQLAQSLRELYVFADKAEAMAAHVEGQLQGGAYAAASMEQLAASLTHELSDLAGDKHLRVFVMPPAAKRSDEDMAEARRRYEERAWRENYGFRRVQILEGNVGYLELRKFADPAVAGDAAAAAMAMLARTEALIIDLRENQGGHAFMVQLLASYLLEEAPKHLVDQEVRSLGATRQIYSLPWLPGERMADVPVYVLTSAKTFSAAEGFTYLLQSLERAEVVGERTAGGAHPVKVVELGNGLAAAIPFARAINPITGTNWEGTGVVPDVEVPASEAFDAAYLRAVEALAESTDDAARRAELQKILATTHHLR